MCFDRKKWTALSPSFYAHKNQPDIFVEYSGDGWWFVHHPNRYEGLREIGEGDFTSIRGRESAFKLAESVVWDIEAYLFFAMINDWARHPAEAGLPAEKSES